jgi:hypothetical protein
MMENLRGVYLPPLRDASQSLKPSRTSQLARLFQLLANARMTVEEKTRIWMGEIKPATR